MTKDETLKAIIAGAKANGSWDKKYPDDKKAQPAQGWKLREVYFDEHGEPIMHREPAQEPPSEWAGIKAILDEYGLQAIDFVADWKAAQPVQEPVAWIVEFENGEQELHWNDTKAALGETQTPLYTTPQPRPWVEPAQEPVAWAVYDKRGGSKSLHWPENHSPNGDATMFDAVPLVPQRPWVELTDEEIQQSYEEAYKIKQGRRLEVAFAQVIEAALRSKNT